LYQVVAEHGVKGCEQVLGVKKILLY
jgi:hypothetical protein